MRRKKSISVESFLVVVLMIVFASAITVMIMQGSKSFNQLASAKQKTEELRVAMSYINMMVKQNDRHRHIAVDDALNALIIEHSDEEAGLATTIYHKDGVLYEQYSDRDSQLSPEMSTALLTLKDIHFSFVPSEQLIEINYRQQLGKTEHHYTQKIALRAR